MADSYNRRDCKMWIYLTLVTLFAFPVHSFFRGTCLRKEPPPGVLVVPPRSKMTLTCSGHVMVDGAKVTVTRDNTVPKRGGSTVGLGGPGSVGTVADVLGKREEGTVTKGFHSQRTEGTVVGGAGQRRGLLQKNQPGYSDAPPTAATSQLTTAAGPVESDWKTKKGENSEEEAGDRSRRPLGNRPQWRVNGSALRKEDIGLGMFERMGSTLTLLSVGLTDSGKYSCHDRSQVLSSFKVIVADPPKNPVLSCYKRSISSKMRCEWSPSQPVIVRPQCYLFLIKEPPGSFSRSECSYSSRLSRCWCVLDHNDDELRIIHKANLCATSIAGNATSKQLVFTPWEILTPDPPSQVAVRAVEGHERSLRVTWNYPVSWKPQDHYLHLNYEISYQPTLSSKPQIKPLLHHNSSFTKSFTIIDALSGVEYKVQMRAKEQFEGQWSEWSPPVYASSWTAERSTEKMDSYLSVTADPFYTECEGSGTDGSNINVLTTESNTEDMWLHAVWICGSCVLLSVFLAASTIRHRGKIVSKLRSLSMVTACTESTPPAPAPTPQEGQALVTFARYRERLPNQVEEEEAQNDEKHVLGREEAMHFSNTSYFLVQRN